MRGKLARALAVFSVGAGSIVPLLGVTNAHAAGGTSGPLTDRTGDTVNYALHPQNTLRKGVNSLCGSDYCYGDPTDTSGSDPLRRPAIKPLDIKGYQLDAGLTRPGYFTATMEVDGNILRNGDPITSLPKGFTAVDYAWLFTTTTMDRLQDIGDDCSPLESNQSIDRYSRVYLQKWAARAGQFCPKAKNPGDEDKQLATLGNQAVLSHDQVMEVPHYKDDHWWLVIAVAIEIVNDGPGPNNGHFCKAVQGVFPPQCLKSYVRWGIYEGISGVQQMARQDQNVGPPIFGPTYLSNSKVQVQVPYAPLTTGGVDDDLLIDDTAIFPTLMGSPVDRVTSLVAETTGSVQVGTPTAGVNRVCPVGSSFTPEGPLPKEVGLPSNVSPDPNNRTCANYLTGLLTLQDWAPDSGVELRVYPRSWSYTASAQSLTCRYPIGSNWQAALGLPVALGALPNGLVQGNVQIGPSNSGTAGPFLGLDPTPYESNWTLGLAVETFPASGGTGSRQQVVPNQQVNGVPQLSAAHGNYQTPLGKDTKCGYTDWPFGLHVFNNGVNFPMG